MDKLAVGSLSWTKIDLVTFPDRCILRNPEDGADTVRVVMVGPRLHREGEAVRPREFLGQFGEAIASHIWFGYQAAVCVATEVVE